MNKKHFYFSRMTARVANKIQNMPVSTMWQESECLNAWMLQPQLELDPSSRDDLPSLLLALGSVTVTLVTLRLRKASASRVSEDYVWSLFGGVGEVVTCVQNDGCQCMTTELLVLLSLLDLYYLYYEFANNDPDATTCLVWLNRREFQFQRSCTWIHLWLLCDVELKVLWGWVGWGSRL